MKRATISSVISSVRSGSVLGASRDDPSGATRGRRERQIRCRGDGSDAALRLGGVGGGQGLQRTQEARRSAIHGTRSPRRRVKAFLIHEGELPRPDEKTPLEKHCPTCRYDDKMDSCVSGVTFGAG